MSSNDLVERIRGEFREMPGLRLTLPQACRLWHLDRATCTGVLDTLVRQQFLHQLADGAYIAWPPRPEQIKATLTNVRARVPGRL